MSEENSTQNQVSILPHLADAFARLSAIARICFNFPRNSIAPYRIRTNSLILGPSGIGKSFLAKELARAENANLFSVSISEWVLLGCSSRGGPATWPNICDFLWKCRDKEGAIIFLDEADKLKASSPWQVHLLTEAFSLLDQRIPPLMNDSDGDRISDQKIAEAQKVLDNKTLILAAGAFQHIWDSRGRPTMGYIHQANPEANPDLKELSQTIPLELAARFGANHIVINPLVENDYSMMLDSAVASIPAILRSKFLQLGRARIPEAYRLQRGARFVEEIILDTILSERSEIASYIPKSSQEEELEMQF